MTEEEYFKDKNRECVIRRHICNPAQVSFCQCWWESADQFDFYRRYDQARLATEQKPTVT
jgi:hypothetical protein